VSFQEKRRKIPVPVVVVKQASGALHDGIHASALMPEGMSKAAFYRACVTIRHQSWLSPVVAVKFTAI
jgi:hypothetical protein